MMQILKFYYPMTLPKIDERETVLILRVSFWIFSKSLF